jgi:AbiU2
MKSDQVEKGTEEAEAIAEALSRDTITAISLERLFERGAAIAKSISPDRRPAFNVVMVSLHSSLVLALMRMMDGSPRSASIPSFVRIFSNPRSISQMLSELEQFARSKTDRSQLSNKPMFGREWAEDEARRTYLESSISSLRKFADIVHDYESFRTDRKFRCLKMLRDKAIAHTNSGSFTIDAKWGYAGSVLKRLVPIVAAIEEISLRGIPNFDGAFDDWTHYAERFWTSLMAQPNED